MIKMTCKKDNTKGFTLIELALVLLIYGLVFTAVLAAISVYSYEDESDQTQEAKDIVTAALREFSSPTFNNRYPCPADPTLGPNDPNYGIEDCSLPPREGYTEDNAGNIQPVSDAVIIGAVPFRTLLNQDPAIMDAQGFPIRGIQRTNLTEKSTFDAWGNKLTYAVTLDMTNRNTFNADEGRINIVDENGNVLLERAGAAHFALISHGEDGIGAYTKSGARVSACGNFVVNPNPNPNPGFTAPIDQTENCMFADGQFSDGIYNSNPNNYFDDHVSFFVSSEKIFWSTGVRNTGLAPPNNLVAVISNTNPGNVGIGTNTPQADLHVLGDVTAREINSRNLCPESISTLDVNGNITAGSCMRAGIFAELNPNMQCPEPGQFVRAISQNGVICDTPFSDTSTWTNTNCPAGEYVLGFNSQTGVICGAMPALP